MSGEWTNQQVTLDDLGTLAEPDLGKTSLSLIGNGLVVRSNGESQATINRLSVIGTVVYLGDLGSPTAAELDTAFETAVGFAPRTGDCVIFADSGDPSVTIAEKRSDGDWDAYEASVAASTIS